MKLAFDVDGVVLRSIDVILEHINSVTGSKIDSSSLLTWDLEPLGIDQQILLEAVDYMYSRDTIEPYYGAVETLEDIHRMSGHPLLFITGRSDLMSAKRQLDSLPWSGRKPEMIITGGSRDKRAYLKETGAEFIIEDDALHLRDYLNDGVGVGLMVQPWNRSCEAPVTARFNGWLEINQWIIKNNGSGEEL
ncbi:MAG: hypothetical protein ACP5U1_00210 [Desulfomonilaceae bacterium]